MEIILLQNIEKVGAKHEVVKVKNGYARNYLIPKKMALIANEANMKRLDDLRAREAAAEAQRVETYRAIAAKLEGATLKIGAKAGASGKIFGSVTNIQLANALKEQFDVDVDRKDIVLPDEVKELGTYTAKLNLHADVQPEVTFEVSEDK